MFRVPRLAVTPDGPTAVEPATAVVSLVAPDAPTSVRESFCNQVHFFASGDAAKGWLVEHPDARVLPVADASRSASPSSSRSWTAAPPTALSRCRGVFV